jgi:hypothetical protein
LLLATTHGVALDPRIAMSWHLDPHGLVLLLGLKVADITQFFGLYGKQPAGCPLTSIMCKNKSAWMLCRRKFSGLTPFEVCCSSTVWMGRSSCCTWHAMMGNVTVINYVLAVPFKSTRHILHCQDMFKPGIHRDSRLQSQGIM